METARSTTKTLEQNVTDDPVSRPLEKPVNRRKGWAVRPWKGPLPRPRRSPPVILADFLPHVITVVGSSISPDFPETARSRGLRVDSEHRSVIPHLGPVGQRKFGGPRGRDRDQPRPGSIKAETQSQLNHRPHQGAGHQQPHQNPVIAVPAKAKKPRPPHCHRCKVSGHTMLECKADLDYFVCNKKNSHRAERCPVLKLPKPTGNLFGFGKTETGFLQIPDFDFKFDTPSPVPTALVSIGGGHLSADNVQGELARLVRADWKWEAIPHEQNSYLVTFPSAEELKRMDDVEFRLKNHGVSLSISDWKSSTDVTPAYQLDEVWVHITGVPHKWRHYLAFWALGCVVGVTQEVDMLTFRQKGIIRVRVALLSRADLPITTDLLFGGGFRTCDTFA
ncbi:hypothetical protein DAI22_04g049300 [Oryza sativa Japonica Group]|nr:hypothetical protein DAI22_04g049300 [Oryza sativa Japonica Group]